jgi:riboflavin synthase
VKNVFTGIVEEIGAVSRRSGAEIAILAEVVLEDLHLGDSIAVDGTCLTVVAILTDQFVAQVSPETYARTTLGDLRPGHAVNLERAMPANGRFGGHFVQGHVDGVGRIESKTDQGEFCLVRLNAPAEVGKYLVPKGSICVDGVSLTVVDPRADSFSVAVIPATLAATTLNTKPAGASVNLEADTIGKHIYHYLHGDKQGGITKDYLARHGFA